MQMKISEEKQNSIFKNIKYIALLGGLLALVASYFLGYSNVKVSNDELKMEIDSLQARLDDLETKKSNQKMYEEGIKTFTADTEKILSGFDAGLSPERLIMDYQELTDSLGVAITNISFSEPEVEYTFSSSGDSSVDTEFSEESALGLIGYSKSSNLTVTGNYTSIKDFLTKLVDSAGRRRVPSTIGFAFDSAINSVTCSVSLKEYAVVGGERTETVPTIPGYNKGVDNIFFSGGVGVVVQ
jgi:hypothetical protein